MFIRRSAKLAKQNKAFYDNGMFFTFADGKTLRTHTPHPVGSKVLVVKNTGFVTNYLKLSKDMKYKDLIVGKYLTGYLLSINIGRERDILYRKGFVGTIAGYDLVVSSDGKKLLYLYRLEYPDLGPEYNERYPDNSMRPPIRFILSPNVQILK